MKIVKLLLKIIFVLVFIFSVLFNIFYFSSSYSSLLFKYDKSLFSAMADFAATKYDSTYFSIKENTGLQFEINYSKKFDGCESLKFKVYIDKNKNGSYLAECSYTEDQTVVKDSYSYKDGKISYKAHNSDSISTEMDFSTSLISVQKYLPENNIVLYPSLDVGNPKTSFSFSFKPLYVLGISYKYKDSANTVYEYHYDLKGRLRKVVVSQKDLKITYTLNYKSEKVD